MANIIEITDPLIPELQIFTDLTHGDPLECGPLFLAESEKIIEYALIAGCRPVSFLMERQDTHRIGIIRKWPDTPVYTGSRETIRQLTGYALDRGFLCAMERPAPATIREICSDSCRLVVLRNVADPTDLGAIFRSAAALGIDGILIGEGCCDPLYRRSVRVSMGTVFQVPWTKATDSFSLLPDDYSCITVSQSSNAAPLDPGQWRSSEKLAIIFDEKKSYDSYCIPLHPNSEPLNLAAASAVLFWMLRKP